MEGAARVHGRLSATGRGRGQVVGHNGIVSAPTETAAEAYRLAAMAWSDRDYNRNSSGGPQEGLARVGNWLWNGRVNLYEAWGIRVALHSTFVVYIAISLLFNWTQGYDLPDKIATLSLLFGLVLLHEYGHCFGARAVGGEADDILMWPLGGLAFTSPPRRPLPAFITTAAGPAVNLVVCALCLLVLAFTLNDLGGLSFKSLFNPFRFIIPYEVALTYSDVTFWVWYCFKVSWLLFCFNVFLPIFPLDGGRMVQEVLWARVGYYRSMVFATFTGQIGCGVLAALGVWQLNFMLIVLGVLFFLHNRQLYQQVKAAGPHAFGADEQDEPWRRSLRINPDEPDKVGFVEKRRRAKQQRNREREAAATAQLEADVDAILDKIHRQGMHTLTKREKQTLERARSLK